MTRVPIGRPSRDRLSFTDLRWRAAALLLDPSTPAALADYLATVIATGVPVWLARHGAGPERDPGISNKFRMNAAALERASNARRAERELALGPRVGVRE